MHVFDPVSSPSNTPRIRGGWPGQVETLTGPALRELINIKTASSLEAEMFQDPSMGE